MKNLSAILCLTIAALLISPSESKAIPAHLCVKDANGNFNPRFAFICKKQAKSKEKQKKFNSPASQKNRQLKLKKREEARQRERCRQKRHMMKPECKILRGDNITKATTRKSLNQYCDGGRDFKTLGCKGYSTLSLARRLRGDDERRDSYYKMIRDEFIPLAESGHPVFAYLLGGLFKMDPRLGGMGDHKGALRWYKLAEKNGFGSKSKADKKALARWMDPLLAQSGDVNAQFKMGQRFKKIADKVRRKSKERKTAVKWFELAAKQGHVASQRYLGQFYAAGWGTRKDYKQAAKWFESSAKTGDAESKYELGQLYEKGRGVSQDFVLAKKFYIEASNTGFKKAKNAIPLMEKRRIEIAQAKEKRRIEIAEAKEWEERKKNSSSIKTPIKGYEETVRVLHEYYIGEIIIGKCVGSEIFSKRDQNDYRKRLNRLVKGAFDSPEYKVPPKDYDTVKDMIFDKAQHEYQTNSGYMSYLMLEATINFGRPISNYQHKAKARELCGNVKTLFDGMVNGLLMSVEKNKKKKRDF
jgi:TPR repeat protein